MEQAHQRKKVVVQILLLLQLEVANQVLQEEQILEAEVQVVVIMFPEAITPEVLVEVDQGMVTQTDNYVVVTE